MTTRWLLSGIILIWSVATDTVNASQPQTSQFLLPVLATSENDGNDYGVLPVFLSSTNDHITTIVAPLFIYNEFLGARGTVNLIGFPSEESDYRVIASYTETIERKFTAQYRNYRMAGSRLTMEMEGGFFKNATARFFGVSNRSRQSDETNYTDRESYAQVTVGYRLTDEFELQLTERFRDVDIQTGGIDSLPFIQDNFSTITGIDGATTLGHRIGALYDSRDHRITPTEGMVVLGYAELNQNLGSDLNGVYTRYNLEYTGLFPIPSKRFILVTRARLQTMFGDDVPFFERSSLGGETTLRGFGIDRFIDDHLAVLNVEERILVFNTRIFGTMTEWEVAPFLDVGTVFNTFASHSLGHWQANPGIGFRGIARPNVAARVDVGFGSEGAAVFAGLDFPF